MAVDTQSLQTGHPHGGKEVADFLGDFDAAKDVDELLGVVDEMGGLALRRKGPGEIALTPETIRSRVRELADLANGVRCGTAGALNQLHGALAGIPESYRFRERVIDFFGISDLLDGPGPTTH